MARRFALFVLVAVLGLGQADEATQRPSNAEAGESDENVVKSLAEYGPLCDEGRAPPDFCVAVRRAQFELLLEQHNFQRVQQKRDYDFVRFGRSAPLADDLNPVEKKASSYDYIRFGKRASGSNFGVLRNFGRGRR